MKLPLIACQHIWHITCCLLALLASLPLLWPRMLPHAWRASAPEYAGDAIMAAILVSLTVLGIASLFMLLRLRNLRTLLQCAIWAFEWLLTGAIFAVLAYFANVPPPPAMQEPHVTPQSKPPVFPPSDIIEGPHALAIPIVPDSPASATLQSAPHLVELEARHPDLLRAYVSQSPRWAASLSDQNFYTKPWHVVMILQDQDSGPGFVHVAFMHLVDGEQLPAGYAVVKGGSPFPELSESGKQFPDLALDLDGSHYLLLAWRGPDDSPHARGAINAAIRAVDGMVRPLAENPTQATLSHLISGSTHAQFTADSPSAPDILLSEPYAQSGCYQAQILANPGEKGYLILRLVDNHSRETLLNFEIPAHHSHNPDELFIHNIPGDIPSHLRHTVLFDVVPPKAPLFIIRQDSDQRAREVVFELYFRPAGKEYSYPILSKIYSVHLHNE